MRIRRTQLAKFAHRAGLTRLIATLARTPSLLVLGYHRIGDFRHAEYDPDVFSASADEFYDQVSYLKATYGIATCEELLAGPSTWSHGTRILLTFDDGYLDNYTTAYPILRSLGVQGTFLLPTGFIGSSTVPWWDAIAYMISRSAKRHIRVPCLTSEIFDRSQEEPVMIARRILRFYRESNDPHPGQVLQQVSESTRVIPPQAADHRRFLNWAEAREMVDGGMAIGSHSHTHPLLGGLPVERQMEEALVSMQQIRENLRIAARVFALPCGSCSPETAGVLAAAGYEMSLSTESGPNLASTWDPFRIRRVLVSRDERKESARLRLAIMAGLGRFSAIAGVR
jgi:peptidoglycan/xylan/chitin deacetylase (PgdA/CDA1 family)